MAEYRQHALSHLMALSYKDMTPDQHIAAAAVYADLEYTDLMRATASEPASDERVEPERSKSEIPDIPVGTTGTATINGVTGGRVFRAGVSGVMTWWVGQDGTRYPDHEVTDFKPDQEPLADWEHELLDMEREKEIRADERERIASHPRMRWHTLTDVRGWIRGGAR